MDFLAARGVTAVHHLGTWPQVDIFRVAERRGLLKTRIYACTPLEQWERLAKEVKERGRGNDWLRIGGLKGYVDGSLGSHTAAFLEPFSDKPGDRGLAGQHGRRLGKVDDGGGPSRSAGRRARDRRSGDSDAARYLSSAWRRRTARATGDFASSTRSTSRPQDMPRFAKLGVIASMQPYHAIDDGRWAEA